MASVFHTASGIAFAVWNTIALSSRTVFLGTASPGTIKSIQRGTVTITFPNSTATATLSPAVDTNKTELRNTGWKVNLDASINHNGIMLILDSSTQVLADAGTNTDASGESFQATWEVTERYG